MNKFSFRLRIIECPGTLPSTGDHKAVRVKIAVEPEITHYRYLRLAMATCEASASSADRCLQQENVTAARRAFAQAEAAFADTREHLQELGRADWRQQIEHTLDGLGSKLDQLWVKLMAAARSPLSSGS